MTLQRQVQHNQAGALETGADGRARAEAFPGPGQDFFGGLLIEPLIQRLDLTRRQYFDGSLQSDFPSLLAAGRPSGFGTIRFLLSPDYSRAKIAEALARAP